MTKLGDLLFEEQSRFRAGHQWVYFEAAVLQAGHPILDQGEDVVDPQVLMKGGVLLEVGVGEFEKSEGGSEAVLFQMHEGAGELYQAFIKIPVGGVPLREPHFLEDIVGFKIKAAIEALEVSEVMRVQRLPAELLNDAGDFCAFFAHQMNPEEGNNSHQTSQITNANALRKFPIFDGNSLIFSAGGVPITGVPSGCYHARCVVECSSIERYLTMKTLMLSTLLCVGTVGVLQADPVIQFDDLPNSLIMIPVPVGYHELNWSNFTYVNGVLFPGNPSGIQAGVVSQDAVIDGGGGVVSTISAGMFDFLSAYATAAWNDNLQLEAKGFIKGRLVYDQTNTLSATASNNIPFNFYGVDRVELTSSGGTPHPGYNTTGTDFVMDDVSVVTYVPYTPALVTNGGFETGDFSGWFQQGNTNFTSVSAGFAHSGAFGAEIGPQTTPGFLLQDLGPTMIGQSYTVSFWLENTGGGVNSFTSLWGGFPVFGITNGSGFSYTNIQFNVTASRPTESFEFQIRNDPAFFGLDDVSVTPTVLVSNGGFETGDFSGWTHTGNTSEDAVSVADARGGSFGAGFGAINTPSFLSQQINTPSAQPYLISAWLNNIGTGAGTNEFTLTWGGNTLADQTNVPVAGWTNLHYTVVNGNPQNTLQFALRNDPSFFLLDEVSVIPVPILQNGGFEFGDFTGWTTNGDFSFTEVNMDSDAVNSGFYGAEFGAENSLALISQTFTTVPGQAYLIGFVLDNPQAMTNTEFQVSWNGAVLYDTTNLDIIGKIPFQFAVAAAGTNSTLQFGAMDEPSFLGLDDVFVSPIPTPAIQSVNKTNGSVNVSWSAFPGYIYQLQYTTNLSHPNWQGVQSYSFPTNFPMSGTDMNPPDKQRFYRVQMAPPPLIF